MIPAMVSSLEPVRVSIETMPPLPPTGLITTVPTPSLIALITEFC